MRVFLSDTCWSEECLCPFVVQRKWALACAVLQSSFQRQGCKLVLSLYHTLLNASNTMLSLHRSALILSSTTAIEITTECTSVWGQWSRVKFKATMEIHSMPEVTVTARYVTTSKQWHRQQCRHLPTMQVQQDNPTLHRDYTNTVLGVK